MVKKYKSVSNHPYWNNFKATCAKNNVVLNENEMGFTVTEYWQIICPALESGKECQIRLWVQLW